MKNILAIDVSVGLLSALIGGCSISTTEPIGDGNPYLDVAHAEDDASIEPTAAVEELGHEGPEFAMESRKAADVVFVNGYVYTVDVNAPLAKAVAVRDAKIVFVGTNAKAQRFVGEHTRVIDLNGRMLMPGLIDSHLHLDDGASSLLGHNLGGIQRTMDDLRAIVQGWLDTSASEEPDGWLEVQGYRGALPRGYQLTRADLDLLATTRPILVENWDHHGLFVNSRALDICGVTPATPDIPGGVIGRDDDGNLTGFFADAARSLILDCIPPPSTPADPLVAARTAVRALNRASVTTAMQAIASETSMSLHSTLLDEGSLTLRLANAIAPDVYFDVFGTDQSLSKAALRRLKALRSNYQVKDRFLVDTVKVILDGVPDYPAQNAWMLEPYFVQDEDEQWVPGVWAGEPFIASAAYIRGVTRLNLAGWQVHTHALGDATARLALDAYEHAQEQGASRDLRNTIVHLEFVDPIDIPRFAELNVVANLQSQWWEWDASTFDATNDFLGPQRMARIYPGRAFEQAGAPIASGSDWPVDPLMPWYALERAVTRTAEPWYGYSEMGPLVAEQAIVLDNAIRYYTVGSAYQLHLENKVGSITKGKYADLIVLDRNIFEIPIEQVDQTQVVMTMFNGEVVYEQ